MTNANANVPGTLYNAWNLVNDSEWHGFNVYQQNDYVFYEDFAYRVVNPTNANNNVIPGTVNDAWNRVGTLYYQSYNTYAINDIAIYENVTYIALQTATNITPGTPGSETYWALYSN